MSKPPAAVAKAAIQVPDPSHAAHLFLRDVLVLPRFYWLKSHLPFVPYVLVFVSLCTGIFLLRH